MMHRTCCQHLRYSSVAFRICGISWVTVFHFSLVKTEVLKLIQKYTLSMVFLLCHLLQICSWRERAARHLNAVTGHNYRNRVAHCQ